ncbi:MAG: phage portal protein [Rhodobacteraceae bacterium]|nr:phage portal protein [Paracoccaceae bacterium]
MMNLLARIKAAFTNERWMQSTMTVLRGSDTKRPPFVMSSAVAAYRSWIYAAANLNAVAVASQPLRLYVKSKSAGTKLWHTRKAKRRVKAYLAGDLEQIPSRYALGKAAEYGDNYEVVEDAHPILTLLSKVNPYQNGFDAAVLRTLYGELTGNAYLHPVIDQKLGIPVELWTMPSQYVEIMPGQEPGDPFVKGYRYGSSEEQKRVNQFAPDEVIHFKRPNPADVYYGIGKVEAAWGATMANEALHEMDHAFFQNKARPDYLLVVKSPAHDDELERLEVSIDEKLRGTKRTGRFLTTTADVDLKPLSFPPKDLAGREQIVEEIAAVFGVPVSMLKANDPNLASATVGFASWKQTTILPLLRMDEETLNQNLLPLFGIEDDAFLAYDNPVSEDERFAFEKMRSMVAGGIMTANEARMREGLEAVEDPMADALLVNGQPLGGPAPAAPLGLASAGDTQNAALTFEPVPEAPLPQPERKDALSDCVSGKVGTLIAEGYPQDQAVAIAYSMCSDGKSATEAAMSLGLGAKAVDADDLETKALGDIDTRPPQGVADNARRALEVRARKPESERGMTAVGIARARDLANRVSLSEDTIRRMLAYFERHEVDKQGSTWDEQGKGWQAWNGWGGDDGWAWARRKVEEFNRERERNTERKRKSCGCCEKNGGGDPPAKPSERISGSDRNPEGSASGSRGGIEISEATEEALKSKVDEHNAEHGEHRGMKIDLGMLKAVYRRGAGAFSTSHRTGVGREQWALARVNAFLYLVRNGKPEDADYTTDFDLLPEGHPKKSDAKRISLDAIWKKAIESDEVETPWILTKASERDAAREFDKITKQEDEIGSSVARIFDRQVRAVLEKIRSAPLPTADLVAEVETLLASKRWNTAVVDALRPYLEDALNAGIGVGRQTLEKLSALPVTFDKRGDDLRAYARTESIRLASRAANAVNGYTAIRFREILGDGVANGETIPQLADRVKEWAQAEGDAERQTKRRALTIARTEAQRASRRAEVEAWKASGVVTGKTWLLAPDPCEFCEAASDAFSKNAVGIDDSFYAQGSEIQGKDGGTMVADYESIDGPPLHPNCRCSLQPRLDDELEEILKEGEAELEQAIAEQEAAAIAANPEEFARNEAAARRIMEGR